MAYLIERKSQTIFVTATSIIVRGKPRRNGDREPARIRHRSLSRRAGEISSAVGGSVRSGKAEA